MSSAASRLRPLLASATIVFIGACAGDCQSPFNCPDPVAPTQPLSMGEEHGCAVKPDGSLWCWGRRDEGNAETPESTLPQRIGAEADWASVCTDWVVDCALKKDGSLWCWGTPRGLLAGDPSADAKYIDIPVPQFPGIRWQSTSCGGLGNSGCGVRDDGVLLCWGKWVTQTDGPTSSTGMHVAAVEETRDDTFFCDDTRWATFSESGWSVSAVRRDGTLWQWRINEDKPPSPKQLGEDSDWALAVEGAQTCALKADGSAWCEIGAAKCDAPLCPIKTPAGVAGWKTIATGGNTTCAIGRDRSLWCWAPTSVWNLGVSEPLRLMEPVRVGNESTWQSVTVSSRRACATRTNGSVACWGWAGDGALGNGTSPVVSEPTQIQPPSRWRSVSQYFAGTCAVAEDTTLWCGGIPGSPYGGLYYNSDKDGLVSWSAHMTKLGDVTGAADVEIGESSACVTRSPGTIWCWGSNADPGKEDWSDTNRHEPIQIGQSSDWKLSGGLAVAESYTCALKQDGTLWCWGRVDDLLGEYPPLFEIPTPIGEFIWNQISYAAYGLAGIQADGSLWLADKDESKWQRLTAWNDWKQVDMGTGLAGLRADGTVYTQDLSVWDRTELVAPPQLPPSRMISSSQSDFAVPLQWSLCGVALDGRLWCVEQHLSLSEDDPKVHWTIDDTPTFQSASDWASVHVSSDGFGDVMLGLKQDGTLWGWGSLRNGHLGLDEALVTTPQTILK